jgi:hypothetical protein
MPGFSAGVYIPGFSVFGKILLVACRVLLEYKWVVLTVTTLGIFMAALDSNTL